MKNKKLAYILVPLVIIIWGIIFYRIYKQWSDNEYKSSKGLAIPKGKDNDSISDTFQLLLNYRDPFQGYSFRTEQLTPFSRPLGLSNKKVQKNTESFNWPSFIYGGMIINQKNKVKTGILTINNTNLLVKEGEVHQGYKIIKLFSDSVYIGMNKLRKTINRL